ncbi:DUF302 domain-containing protein [Cupriavidus sp. WKF15]|uniref:DUF302 domain-containing protein n=1 Tax=Cupriavidus sp. WKF15 TaxID=3032282 RepID=UPI0023E25E21|nr:DUF302 domain-containing protein [Cupriavidus sp. WKF15]WER50310.1 DUF302 domain-containing protein [Cupriavidus sp. WKF15]
MTIFARIERAEAARNAGLAMPLTHGNAKRGTPLMLAAPSVALDLPLVRDDCQGSIWVSFYTAEELEGAHPLPAGSVAPLTMAQRQILDTVGAQGAPGRFIQPGPCSG